MVDEVGQVGGVHLTGVLRYPAFQAPEANDAHTVRRDDFLIEDGALDVAPALGREVDNDAARAHARNHVLGDDDGFRRARTCQSTV